MPGIQFTAGSVGDILAVAGLTIKVITKLSQSRKSRDQYLQIIDELKAYQETLLTVHETLDEILSNYTYIRTSAGALQAASMIKSTIDRSRVVLQGILNNLVDYELPLNAVGLRSVWTMVWWAMWEGDQVSELQKRIAGYNQRITILFNVLNANSLSTLATKATVSIPGYVSDPVRNRRLELEVRRSRLLKGERLALMNNSSKSNLVYLCTYFTDFVRVYDTTRTSSGGYRNDAIFELTLGALDLLSLACYRLTVANDFEQHLGKRFSRVVEEEIKNQMESEATDRQYDDLAIGTRPSQALSYLDHVLSLILSAGSVMVRKQLELLFLPMQQEDPKDFVYVGGYCVPSWVLHTSGHPLDKAENLVTFALGNAAAGCNTCSLPPTIDGISAYAPTSLTETQIHFIQSLPKAELHAELLGSIPINVLEDLAAHNSPSVTTQTILQKLRDKAILSKDERDQSFNIICTELISTPQALATATKAAISSYLSPRILDANGSITSGADRRELQPSPLTADCTYVELCIQLYQTSHMSRETCLRTILSTISTSQYTPSQVGIIVSVGLWMPRKELIEIFSILRKFKSKEGGEDGLGKYIVGLQLWVKPGRMKEVGFYKFRSYCEQGKAWGLGVTLFAYESNDLSDKETLELLSFRPDRVNERVLSNDAAWEFVQKNKICIELVPTNCPIRWRFCDIRQLIHDQHPVAICAVAPSFHYTSLTAEYIFARARTRARAPTGYGLTGDEMRRLAQMSLDCRFGAREGFR